MTQKPDSNLPKDAQPWGRLRDKEHEELETQVADLEVKLESIASGDGGQASDIAGMVASISKLFYELKFLYNATGTTYPPVVAPPAPPPPVQPTTVEIAAAWSATWGTSSKYTPGGGGYTDGSYLYQASNPENKIGMFRFDVGPAYGRRITSAAVFLENINSPFQPTFVAQFGTHGFSTEPGPKPSRQNPFDVGWSRGEGKWQALPDWVLPGLSNGTIQGFTVGGGGASDANSAFFMGATMSNPPRLRITYD